MTVTYTAEELKNLFSEQVLDEVFPADRADRFFEAMYGDAGEGAYDIVLRFNGVEVDRETLRFEFRLKERPGKCLRCSLTYGLPEVFKRHPVIELKAVVRRIGGLLDGKGALGEWRLGRTHTLGDNLHVIPLNIVFTAPR